MDQQWIKKSNCVGYTKLMYSPQISKAKQICAGCSVRQECLEYALHYPEYHGIWGGLTEDERLHLGTRRLLAMRRDVLQRNNTREHMHLASVGLSSPAHTSYLQSHTQEVSQMRAAFRVVFR